MFLPLDGPATQDNITVTTASVVEVKSGALALSERKVITFQPLDGDVYMYFGDGSSTPSTSDVVNNGFKFFRNGLYTIEASESQQVFAVGVTTNVDLRFAERG